MPRLVFAAAALAAVLSARPAPAWSMAGHMVTGAIAYESLKQDDPRALAAALALLKAHPSYDKLWKHQLDKVPEADRDLLLFMLAPRWADDIRRTDFDRPTWHYVNLPYKPAGQPAAVPTPDPPAVNILTAYPENYYKLKKGADPIERAVALTWVCHLVGDIQQPLHAATLFTTDYPEGDRGGNRFWVKVSPDGKAINLHYFWDGLLSNSDRFTDVRNTATELRLRPELARDKLPELAVTSFDDWARKESLPLAVAVVYRDGKLAGGTADFAAAVLPADYPKQAKAVGERRGVLAGYRLADVIRQALAE